MNTESNGDQLAWNPFPLNQLEQGLTPAVDPATREATEPIVQAVREDRFSLWWMAHELHYALPDTVFDKLRNKGFPTTPLWNSYTIALTNNRSLK